MSEQPEGQVSETDDLEKKDPEEDQEGEHIPPSEDALDQEEGMVDDVAVEEGDGR